MIELEDFIAETMIAVASGIVKAQQDDSVGIYIAPLIQGQKRNDFVNFHLKGDDRNQATVLQFEVNIGAKSIDEKAAGGKVKAKLYVVDVEVGGDAKEQVETSNLQKLKFSVPLQIPQKD